MREFHLTTLSFESNALAFEIALLLIRALRVIISGLRKILPFQFAWNLIEIMTTTILCDVWEVKEFLQVGEETKMLGEL